MFSFADVQENSAPARCPNHSPTIHVSLQGAAQLRPRQATVVGCQISAESRLSLDPSTRSPSRILAGYSAPSKAPHLNRLRPVSRDTSQSLILHFSIPAWTVGLNCGHPHALHPRGRSHCHSCMGPRCLSAPIRLSRSPSGRPCTGPHRSGVQPPRNLLSPSRPLTPREARSKKEPQQWRYHQQEGATRLSSFQSSTHEVWFLSQPVSVPLGTLIWPPPARDHGVYKDRRPSAGKQASSSLSRCIDHHRSRSNDQLGL